VLAQLSLASSFIVRRPIALGHRDRGKEHCSASVRKPSEDKANAYFADGIQDEILTRLSKIADLKVIFASTSSQRYKDAH
jgi:hypothetical protein